MWNSSEKDLRFFPDKTTQDHIDRANLAYTAYVKRNSQDKTSMNGGVYSILGFFDPNTFIGVQASFPKNLSSISKKTQSMVNDQRILHTLGASVRNIIGEPDNSRFWDEIENNTFYQKIHNRPEDNDIQKQLHIDTFFPCWKFWYFPWEVRINQGPLRYVKTSHALYCKEEWMREQYDKFYANKPLSEYSKQGSLRIDEDEAVKLYGQENIISIGVPENTLLVANVFGFHSRAEVETEHIRYAIHGSIRYSDPFK
jgi:hypothetical protein